MATAAARKRIVTALKEEGFTASWVPSPDDPAMWCLAVHNSVASGLDADAADVRISEILDRSGFSCADGTKWKDVQPMKINL